MTIYIALLRAVNVGGTGKLPMSELKALCQAAGFQDVRTYIASGNVIFQSKANEAAVKKALEAKLTDYASRPVDVLVRTAAELANVVSNNPFPDKAANRTLTIFLDAPPPTDTLDSISGRSSELLHIGVREIYVHYTDGIAGSKLKIPAARTGTARNMNTLAKLVQMSAQP